MILPALIVAALAVTPASATPPYRPLASASVVQDKAFYLFSVLQGDPALRSAVKDDPVLAAEAIRLREAVQTARATCKAEVACDLAPLRWSPEQAERLADALVAALGPARLKRLAEGGLRPSGRFARYADLSDVELVRRAFTDAAAGLDRIDRVYGLGEAPLYKDIDSARHTPAETAWREAVADLLDVGIDDPRHSALFFDLPLFAALALLEMNGRDEAARGEPLAGGENGPALQRARHVVWSRWAYAAILVPGRGPDAKDETLSPEGLARAALAARRFRDGAAPFIILSGGYVSPAQTPYAEALEMKRVLTTRYGVPASAILVDPFARHTTTNLRNAARLLTEAGAGLARPVLITTTTAQSAYIESPAFTARCRKELGYACYDALKRVSPFDTVASLSPLATHRDAADPLDP